MAGPREYDVVVIGAGIEGSATAYHLAKSGQKTLLLEQVSESVQNRCFTGKVSTGRGGTYCHDRYPTNLGSVHEPQSRLVSFNRTSRPTFFLIFLWGLSRIQALMKICQYRFSSELGSVSLERPHR